MRRSLTVLVVLLAAPAAAAMDLSAEAPQRLVPEIPVPWTVGVTVSCDDVLAWPVGQDTVTLSVTPSVDGLTVQGPMSAQVDRSRCLASEEVALEFPLNVTASMLVESEVSHSLQVTATAPAGPTRTRAVEAVVEYALTYNVTVPVQHKQAAPQRNIDYIIEITAYTNQHTRFSFRLDGVHGGGSAIPPDALLVERRGQEPSTGTAIVTLATPYKNGANHDQTRFNVTILPTSVRADTPGPATTVELRGDTRGI